MPSFQYLQAKNFEKLKILLNMYGWFESVCFGNIASLLELEKEIKTQPIIFANLL